MSILSFCGRAVLGDIDALRPRLMLEALRQEWQKAKTVVWISDGGKGFWRLYQECFSQRAIAILDFYHAAQNLTEGGCGLSRWSHKESTSMV